MPCKVGDVAWRSWRVLAKMMVKWGPHPREVFFFASAFVERQARQSYRNVRIWDRTSTPTSHFRTRFGSNMRPNFGLYVRIGIGHGANFGPISVRIGIGHVPALSSVLFRLQRASFLDVTVEPSLFLRAGHHSRKMMKDFLQSRQDNDFPLPGSYIGTFQACESKTQ